MTSSAVLVTSAVIELLFEGIVDALALDIESRNGVDLDLFWGMWRRNAPAFWGVAVTNGFVAILGSIWAFKQVPTIAFCTSPIDPCSCKGGGFQIFDPFCNATTAAESSNETSAQSNKTSTAASLVDAAKDEYKDIFGALGVDATLIIVSVGVGVLVVVVFIVARIAIALAQAKSEKARAERHAAELYETNLQIQDQLMLTQLNAKQVAIVEANSGDLDKEVPVMFKLNWRVLVFEGRLGSGSFGDCFKGRCESMFYGPQTRTAT